MRKSRGDRVSKGDVLAVVESNEGLVPYEVKSLIEGTVIDKHITLGEVMSDAHPAFVIASLDTVWVNLDIYQTHLSSVAVGQNVTISAQDGIPDLMGRISYISPVVDEQTRATSARVVIPNVGGKWRPGMFVTGRITVSEETVPILVPGTALQSMETHSIVFVETHEGYEAREVQTGRTANDMAEIIAGLNPGERYVSKGGFTLKAELMKGGFDDGHNH